MQHAVLLMLFNRPDLTSRVAESIRAARPARIYLAADGPRSDREGEAERCEAARTAALSVDWDCEVLTRFEDSNHGCRFGMGGAIRWFLDHEEEGVILEDDTMPDPSFFPYVTELLERYRDDDRVMVVSGDHIPMAAHQPPASYWFSRHNQTWGWGTWRRAYDHYRDELEDWPERRETDWLLGIGNGHRDFSRYWTWIFDETYAGMDSWQYRWTYACWKRAGVSIMPARNLVLNIGFNRPDATHTPGTGGVYQEVRLESLDLPLVHPASTRTDERADRWLDLRWYRTRPPLHVRLLAPLPGVRRAARWWRERRARS